LKGDTKMESLEIMKKVVNKLKGFLKKKYDFNTTEGYKNAYHDLEYMFKYGSEKSINGLFLNAHK
jgi:hypothetical protein